MPVAASTGTAQMATDTTAFDRGFRYALRSKIVFAPLADVMPVDQTHAGSAVTFNLRNDLALATTALTELADVAPVAGSDTVVTISLAEYGNVEVVSARLRGTNYIREMVRTANAIGYNAAKSFDTLARDPLLAGTNVLYPDNYNSALAGTSRVTIAAADVFQSNAVRLARVRLANANVETFDDGLYKAYIAPDVAYDLRQETGAAAWREPHNNAGDPSADDAIWNGSIGTYEGFDFIEAQRLSAGELPSGFVNGGVGSTVDVYPTVFAGREALAKVFTTEDGVSGSEPKLVESPVTDNLRRFKGVGWYWLGGFGRFREAALYRVESSSSIGANT